MERTLIIILLALFLSGCSNKQAAGSGATLDRIVAGQDSSWSNGYVLSVAKRDGSLLHGVRITQTAIDGQVTVFTADEGIVSKGPDPNLVIIQLKKAEVQKGNNKFQSSLLTINLSQ